MSKVVQSKTVLTAPNLKRLGAFLIDHLILYIVFAVYFAFLGITPDSTGNVMIYVGAVALALAYRILIPVFVFKGESAGQSVGKKAMGLKVINANGTQVGLLNLSIRQAFFLIIEGFDVFAISYLFSAIGLMGFPQIFYLAYMNIAVSLLSVVLMFIKPSHRLLHHYVSNTVVILAKQ